MFFADIGADAQSVVPPVSFEAVCFAGAVQFIVGVALKLSDKTGFQVNVDLAVTGGGFIADQCTGASDGGVVAAEVDFQAVAGVNTG